MPAEVVVDASVAAKLYFDEVHSSAARAALASGDDLVAPALILVEMASIAAKRVRRGLSPLEPAKDAVRSVRAILDYVAPIDDLCERAFELACDHGFSAYDGVYLALAEVRNCAVLTADEKLVRRAGDSRLGHLVRALVT